jgi:hypothetical protein
MIFQAAGSNVAKKKAAARAKGCTLSSGGQVHLPS